MRCESYKLNCHCEESYDEAISLYKLINEVYELAL